ncbi:substrate-binding domain-containing protein [Mangrovicoccus sp. HB161399]|uniref:substrate-binding domain-containing protein n=1 Tax=Mangrovicoccus sp. HB161399 TaxID=2720392 RepID=UPI00155564C7|nr:substrate-binding domain-containing protein [Mangrovicoccus sp. HB161399]
MTKFLLASSALAGALALAGAAMAEEPTKMGEGADIAAMCGTKPARIALIDGIGGDTWRRTTQQELRAEAAKCPNITEIRYSDAGGDQQKYNSDINSFVAQGFDIIIAFADFGDASIPAYRAATRAGVTMVPYFSKLTGQPGRDYTVNVYQDQTVAGHLWADWIGDHFENAKIVMLGGMPGAASSTNFFNGLKEGMEKHPDIELLQDTYVTTNWNMADAQRATAGLIATYPKIDAIIADHGPGALAAVNAFQQAGEPVPAMLTIASGNELNCKWEADKEAGNPWDFYALDGTTTIVRFALRRALAEFEGTEDPESLELIPYNSVDSFENVGLPCNADLPPDADLSSLLSEEDMKKVFGWN